MPMSVTKMRFTNTGVTNATAIPGRMQSRKPMVVTSEKNSPAST